jgi:predicted GH43/DUF377 family glycosyl hydrolase
MEEEKMKWHKGGLIYAPSGDLWWARSYATIPTAEVIDDQIIRVYFASLDENRYGRIGYVDLDANDPKRVLYETKEPVLDIGELGTFDDSGVNPSCVLNVAGKKYMYYIGWQRCEKVPYMLFAGLASSVDNGLSFTRAQQIPVLDRTIKEPFLRSATTIIVESGLFKCWYVSGLGWTDVNGMQYPTYNIRYTESDEGIYWREFDHICVNLKDDEFGFGRPWVIRELNAYKMWFSIRSRSSPYKIGYAESSNGINWVRKDEETGIYNSDSGWDSEMICYPCVVDVKGKRYMFYNGNRHGSTGFGYAILASE